MKTRGIWSVISIADFSIPRNGDKTAEKNFLEQETLSHRTARDAQQD